MHPSPFPMPKRMHNNPSFAIINIPLAYLNCLFLLFFTGNHAEPLQELFRILKNLPDLYFYYNKISLKTQVSFMLSDLKSFEAILHHISGFLPLIRMSNCTKEFTTLLLCNLTSRFYCRCPFLLQCLLQLTSILYNPLKPFVANLIDLNVHKWLSASHYYIYMLYNIV